MEEQYTTITATFVLEPGKPWVSVDDFKQSMNRFLDQQNMEAILVEGDGGQYGSILLVLRPKKLPPMPIQKTDAVPIEK